MRKDSLFARRLGCLLAVWVFLYAGAALTPGRAKPFIPGRRALVIDERISSLRERPDSRAAIIQRLRRGREVGIVGYGTGAGGTRFLRVAVSRNREGWVLADAIAVPGKSADSRRLLRLIDETADDFARVRLARLCADEFRNSPAAPAALLRLAEAADRIAERLTLDAAKKLGSDPPIPGLKARDIFLNFSGLDRYSRIGLTFDFSEEEGRFVYDGKARREILRKYPRSEEAVRIRVKE